MDASKKVILGEPVIDIDGNAGSVAAVLVKPRIGYAPALVIKRNLLIRKQRVVPVEAVVGSTDEVLHLGITHRELDSFPEFRFKDSLVARELSGPDPLDGSGVQAVRVSQQVVCVDGEAGTVQFVTLDSKARRVNHFVASRRRQDGLVRIDPLLVQEITRSLLLLDARRSDFEALPVYKDDHEIESDVIRALWSNPEVEVAELQNVRVRSVDGIVELAGSVLTQESRYEMIAAARGVPGAISVLDHLDGVDVLDSLAAETIQAIEDARVTRNQR